MEQTNTWLFSPEREIIFNLAISMLSLDHDDNAMKIAIEYITYNQVQNNQSTDPEVIESLLIDYIKQSVVNKLINLDIINAKFDEDGIKYEFNDPEMSKLGDILFKKDI